jgi:uncharacterized protein (TIGR02421 family)
MVSGNSHATLCALNAEYRNIVTNIRLLSTLNWPAQAKEMFLDSVAQHAPVLPKFTYTKPDVANEREALQRIVAALGDAPHGALLKQNCHAYVQALDMMQAVGTARISEISAELYGTPQMQIAGLDCSLLTVAHALFAAADSLPWHGGDGEEYTSEQLQHYLQAQLVQMGMTNEIEVQIDTSLAARAMAIGGQVKIRAATRFKHYEAAQLLQHEVFTHALCSVNGQKQPVMGCMAHSSPRITATQEGLAQCAELLTGNLHPQRLKRIALRVMAIDMAEHGANLLELFRFFEQHGDSANEAYISAMRVLRGGVPEGGILFYKDAAYVRGMLEVLQAMNTQPDVTKLLFAGNVALSDVAEVRALQAQGIVTPATYLPPWVNTPAPLNKSAAYTHIMHALQHAKPL